MFCLYVVAIVIVQGSIFIKLQRSYHVLRSANFLLLTCVSDIFILPTLISDYYFVKNYSVD